MTIKLFWAPRTRASRIVWMLEETGVAYTVVPIDLRSPGAARDPEFRMASPMGKVPALADGEVLMAESAAIGLYLADRYAPGRLAPAVDDPQRGRYLYWMLYTPAVIEPAMSEQVSGVEPTPARSGWADFPTMIHTMERELGNRRWLLGDQFTAADVMVGSSVVFLQQFDLLPTSPVLEEYAARCLERPGYQRAMALDETGPE